MESTEVVNNSVDNAVNSFVVALSAAEWSSRAARAAGMQDLRIAQAGTKNHPGIENFLTKLAETTIRVLIPALFLEIFPDNPKCLKAAALCAKKGTNAAAAAAYSVAAAAAYAANAANTLSDKYLIMSAAIAVKILGR